jgi:hypothetical protein
MARDQVRYVGEPVAVIVAKARHLAEDAAPLVEVDYETTAACVDMEKALAPDTPLVHESEPDNVAGFMKRFTFRQRTCVLNCCSCFQARLFVNGKGRQSTGLSKHQRHRARLWVGAIQPRSRPMS